jgi:hypothetical protein
MKYRDIGTAPDHGLSLTFLLTASRSNDVSPRSFGSGDFGHKGRDTNIVKAKSIYICNGKASHAPKLHNCIYLRRVFGYIENRDSSNIADNFLLYSFLSFININLIIIPLDRITISCSLLTNDR